jgi:hypothetical protein
VSTKKTGSCAEWSTGFAAEVAPIAMLDGFVEGLFGDEETIDLPEPAHRGLEALSEMRALMAAVFQMARDETKAATNQDVQTSLRNVREMTKIAEHEIHAIVLFLRACSRADARSFARHETDAAIDQMPLTSQARRARATSRRLENGQNILCRRAVEYRHC